MSSIYISSTYEDLKDYRQAVVDALGFLRQEVVAMEKYVARDDRPVDQCLADVEGCDLYVGIFAWRHGFEPPHDNPEGRSITEMEYRHARERDKPCLIFLLHKDADWKLGFADSHTGNGDRGKKIAALRDELALEHSVQFFSSPEQLALQVQSAVFTALQERQTPIPVVDRNIQIEGTRDLTHSLFLAYADEPEDRAIVERLNDIALKRGLYLDPTALFASSATDFERLEQGLRQCEQAAVVLTKSTLKRLSERPKDSQRVVETLRARTGQLDTFCSDPTVLKTSERWEFDQRFDLESLAESDLKHQIAVYLQRGAKKRIGLPVVIVAMTRLEAEELFERPELIVDSAGQRAREQFDELRGILERYYGKTPWQHYQDRREAWQPFQPGAGVLTPVQSIEKLLGDMVTRLANRGDPRLRGRGIKPQLYPLDALLDAESPLLGVYAGIAETGCVVVVDELSLFHPRLHEVLLGPYSPLHHDQTAVVTVSPLDPRHLPPYRQLERELSQRLGAAFGRFSIKLDPQCEFSVGDERRLKRWLYNSLPTAIERLDEPQPNRDRLQQFANELGSDMVPRLGSKIWARRGGL